MKKIKKTDNWLLIHRHVRFGDVDSAGVIHFHNLFRWAHEAWEESLQSFGISAVNIFPSFSKKNESPIVALPIVNCKANFVMPIRIGESLQLSIQPQKVDDQSFQVLIKFNRGKDLVASTMLHHIAIDSKTRKRCLLPEDIKLWINSSTTEIYNR